MSNNLRTTLKSTNCTLWMGDWDPTMDEIFLRTAFVTALKSTDPSIIKSIKFNMYGGQYPNYCFVEFSTHDVAYHAQTSLNGLVIPGSMPSRIFKLKWSGEGNVKATGKSKEFSVWVGDLELIVHDHALYEHFASRYHSVVTANIVREPDGRSKGYGFVRFGDQTDQQRSIIELNNTLFYGGSIRVNMANPRVEKAQQAVASYRSPSYQSYSYTTASKSYHQQPPPKYSSASGRDHDRRRISQDITPAASASYHEELEPPQLFDNPVQINREFNQSFGEMWSGLEKSRWHGQSYPNSYIKEAYEDGMIPLLY